MSKKKYAKKGKYKCKDKDGGHLFWLRKQIISLIQVECGLVIEDSAWHVKYVLNR
jgi:hypothetical protein